MKEILIQSTNLKKYFISSGGWLKRKQDVVRAVDNINIEIYKNETLALVGESGCGKSTLGRLLINLVEPTEGEVYYKGQNIFLFTKTELKNFRREAQIIFQDPYASLNPRMKVKNIIGEPLSTHNIATGKNQEEVVEKLMDLVGLEKDYMTRYPHQFSGGQRQRIGIARALALNPAFLICDEPVSALDVSIQSQILNLLKDLQYNLCLTYLFISHNLSVVRYMADRIVVMFLGKVMEMGSCKELFEHPLHPYTQFLIMAVPLPNPKMRNRTKKILEGDVPSPINPPSGCRFHTRCPYSRDICSKQEPSLVNFNGSRKCACHFPLI